MSSATAEGRQSSSSVVKACEVSVDVEDGDKENAETSMSSLRFSELLFTESSDESLTIEFSMRPCVERRLVRQLIDRGGGRMVSSNGYDPLSVNLVAIDYNPIECHKDDRLYYYVTYVYDSCKANQLMPLDDYRVVPKTSTATTPSVITSTTTTTTPVNDTIVAVIADGVNTVDNNPANEVMPHKSSDQLSVDIGSQESDDSPKKLIIDTHLDDNHSDDEEVVTNNDNERATASTSRGGESTKRKSPLKVRDRDEEETTEESDLDFDDGAESTTTTSKYFGSPNRLRPQLRNDGKNFCGVYLDYMKERERTATPDNLLQIKNALKLSKITDNRRTKKGTDKSLKGESAPSQRQKSTTFGEKILQKRIAERRQSNDSQESGLKVSDISSGDEDSKTESSKSDNKKSSVTPKIYPNKSLMRRLKQSSQYTLSEDEAIVEFVLKSRRFDEMKGNSLWLKAEKKTVCEGRTWQSMKERFRRHIMPNIETLDISKKDKQTLNDYFYAERDSTVSRGLTGAYTSDEDKNILHYITRKKAYELVKGRKFWRDMEKDFHSKQWKRTWQSLKERYIKRIVPNLNKYDISVESARQMLSHITSLSEGERRVILKKCEQKVISVKQSAAAAKQSPPKKCAKRTVDTRQTSVESKTVEDSEDEETEVEVETEVEPQKTTEVTVEESVKKARKVKRRRKR